MTDSLSNSCTCFMNNPLRMFNNNYVTATRPGPNFTYFP